MQFVPPLVGTIGYGVCPYCNTFLILYLILCWQMVWILMIFVDGVTTLIEWFMSYFEMPQQNILPNKLTLLLNLVLISNRYTSFSIFYFTIDD